MDKRRDEWLKWVILLVLALVWGSSFILMKRGLFHDGKPVLEPWQMASARLAGSAGRNAPNFSARWTSMAPDSKMRIGAGPLRSSRGGIFELGLIATKPLPN